MLSSWISRTAPVRLSISTGLTAAALTRIRSSSSPISGTEISLTVTRILLLHCLICAAFKEYYPSFFLVKATPATRGPALAATAAPIW